MKTKQMTPREVLKELERINNNQSSYTGYTLADVVNYLEKEYAKVGAKKVLCPNINTKIGNE